MPKTPQDHKAPAAEIAEARQLRFDELDNAHLLKPFSKLKASDSVRLINRLKGALDIGAFASIFDGEDEMPLTFSEELEKIDFDGVGDLIEYIDERYVEDREGWDAFNIAENFQDVMQLCLAYVGEMGKGKDS
ncbi:MAG TPA: hypothetical protein H9821_04670 [Candidatus Rothia avicola]|uniref:Uncharacterized protein n=1 Tax=Candidatus Rothia avicola TaxID=2840478 RepID=A0A9D1ZSK9_9MICC|nr:hypothetical protein [Candidatus Rothia avicola]